MPTTLVATPEPRQLTITEAAAAYGVHVNTVRRWIADGYLRAERVGPRIIRISADDLAALGRTIPSAAAR